MTHEKMNIEEAIAYFKKLSDTFKMSAHVMDDELDKAWYSAKAEAYEIAAFELEHNVL